MAFVSRLAGVALEVVFGALTLARRPRPIHPDGVVLDGRLRWIGGGQVSGMRWIDEPPAAPVDVVARVSRGAGLPAPLPDIIGLALRVGDHGPVLIAARSLTPGDLPSRLDDLADVLERSPWQLRLYWATPLGAWHAFAELELQRTPGPVDRLLRFDAVRHPLPGARHHRWVEALRQPSYELAQRD